MWFCQVLWNLWFPGSVAVVDSSKDAGHRRYSCMAVADVRPEELRLRGTGIWWSPDSVKTEEDTRQKGDANTDPDSGTIPAENIRGTYLFCIPHLGYGFVWKSHVSYRRVSGAVHASGFLFSGERPEPKEREQVKTKEKGELRLWQRKSSSIFTALCGALAVGSSTGISSQIMIL